MKYRMPLSIISFLSVFLVYIPSAFAQLSVQETFNADGYTYSFFSLAATEIDQTELDNTENGTGRISSYNYVTVAKRINYDLKGGVRIPFTYGTAGRDRFNDGRVQDAELLLQDAILFLRNDSIALLPLDVGVFWEGRIYVPTGKYSQRAGTIGAYRNHFIFNKVLSRSFDFEYDQKLTYSHQSRTAYRNRFYDERGDLVDIASLTKSWELEHRFQTWYKLDADTGVGAQITYEDKYYNKSLANSYTLDRSAPLTKRAEHLVKVGPALRFALSPKINFILNYADVVTATENMDELGQFKAENTEVALLSFIRF